MQIIGHLQCDVLNFVKSVPQFFWDEDILSTPRAQMAPLNPPLIAICYIKDEWGYRTIYFVTVFQPLYLYLYKPLNLRTYIHLGYAVLNENSIVYHLSSLSSHYSSNSIFGLCSIPKMSCRRNFEGIYCQAISISRNSDSLSQSTAQRYQKSHIPVVIILVNLQSVKIGADLQLQMRPSLHTKAIARRNSFILEDYYVALYTVMHSLNLSLLCMSHVRFFVHLISLNGRNLHV